MANCLSLAADASSWLILEISRNSSRRPSGLEAFLTLGFFLFDTASHHSFSAFVAPGFRNLARFFT